MPIRRESGVTGRAWCLSALLLILGGILASAPPAAAHGGGFRQGNPNPGAPAAPGGVAPPAPPPPGWVRTSRDDLILQRGLHYLRYDDHTWWKLNIDAFDAPRGRFAAGPATAVTPTDGADAAPPPPAERSVVADRAERRVALPFLRDAVARDRAKEPIFVGAALIAWARMASDRAILTVLRSYARDATVDAEIRECAVLGLGLLRRSDPARRFPTEDLENIRDLLLSIYDDEEAAPVRVRAFALYALGLLADQPYRDSALTRHGVLVTRGLSVRLRRADGEGPLSVALLVALAMQPPAGVPDGLREDLRRIALLGVAFGRPATWGERFHALRAYARLTPGGAGPVLRHAMLTRESEPAPSMQATAAITLAEVAPLLTSADRREAAVWLVDALSEIDDPRVAGLGYLALGALLGADLDDGSTALCMSPSVGPFLLREAREGARDIKPYAALALGVAAHGTRCSSREAAVYKDEIRKALVRGVRETRGADEMIAAHVAAAGLGRAEGARDALEKIVGNKHRFPKIRGYAARALGQLGEPTPRTVAVLLEATRDRIHPFAPSQAVRALGMLDVPEAVDELLAQVEGDPTRGALVEVALSLGYLGDPKAVDRLVLLAKNEKAGRYVRAMAIVSLGLIFDPEDPRSLARFRVHANYFGLTGSLRRVMGIL